MAALGAGGLWVRAVDDGTWRRRDVPRRVGVEGVDLTWVDDATLLLGSWKGGWRLDLATGLATELAGLGPYQDLAVDPAGGYAGGGPGARAALRPVARRRRPVEQRGRPVGQLPAARAQ